MTTDVRDEAASDDATQRKHLEDTRWGRLALSALIVATLLAIFVSVMPMSVMAGVLTPIAGPYLSATGLDQRWGVFSPDPNTEKRVNVARVDHEDGTATVYEPPESVGIANYWDYRWRTYVAQLGGNGREADRVAYARWVADQDRKTGDRPVRVTLLARGTLLAPPGPTPDQGRMQEVPFFSISVTP